VQAKRELEAKHPRREAEACAAKKLLFLSANLSKTGFLLNRYMANKA